MIVALLASSAFAGGLHAGIPVQGLPSLGAATFLSAETGWEAPVLVAGRVAGVARVYVGPTAGAAQAWVEDAARGIQAPLLPVQGLCEQAVGTSTVIVARDGNVAFSVATQGPLARPIAQDLVAAISDAPAAWPAAPVLTERDGLAFFSAPGAVELTVIGGRRPLGEPDGYQSLPSQVVAWDAWGRAAVMYP